MCNISSDKTQAQNLCKSIIILMFFFRALKAKKSLLKFPVYASCMYSSDPLSHASVSGLPDCMNKLAKPWSMPFVFLCICSLSPLFF